MTRLVGLLLAAGRSTRMGTSNKLLLPIDGVPMVRRVAEALAAGNFDENVAVLGFEAEAVARALPPSFRRVVNPAFEEGMGRSLAEGTRALNAPVDGIVVALADTPWLRADTVRALAEAFRDRAAGVSIVVPTCRGRRGHPTVFAAEHRPSLEACRGDVGAKDLFGRRPEAIHWLEVEDEGIWRDVDRPEDGP